MSLIRLFILLMAVVLSGCEEKPFYSEFSKNLTGEIEKEWHLDSLSIRGDKLNRAATPPCVADDKYIFRYDNTLTYFNNMTEYILLPEGFGCGDSTLFEIQLWEIISDTLLNLNGKTYEIESLTEKEMVLRLQNEIMRLDDSSEGSGFDYKFFYARKEH